MKRCKFLYTCALGFPLMFGAMLSRGAVPVMLSPMAALDTDLGTFSPTAGLEKLIDQSGVEQPFVSGVTPFDTYFAKPEKVFAQSGDGGVHNWQSGLLFDLEPHGYVDFDLGAVYTIYKIGIWNRSVKNMQITVRETEDGSAQTGGSFTLINRLNFPFSYAADVLPLTQPLQGRYVRLIIDSLHTFSPGDRFSYAIIGEVIASVTGASPPVDPTVSIARTGSGNVVVTFTGKLVVSNHPEGPFVEVQGNPTGQYEIPRGNLLQQQYYRAVSGSN